jgi:hypothetical protein
MAQGVGMAATNHEHVLISGIISYHVMQYVLCLNRDSNHRERCSFAAAEYQCPSRVCVREYHLVSGICVIWYQSQILAVAMASQPRSKQPQIGDGSGE